MDRGAHFYKCDFQVHTPRDIRWQGAGAVTDEERRAYAEEFVASCRTKGLSAVAITDHHDMAFFKFIRDAALAETSEDGQTLPVEQRLVVFPGMELTLGIPCQALIIFDAEFPVNLLSSAAEALSITLGPPGDARHAEIKRLEHIKGLDNLYEILDQRDFLRGRYIVLPNVSEGGNATLLRSGFAGHYKKMACVGGYVDGAVSQFGKGNAEIVSGKNKDYGNKALGVFQTSDNRRRDFADLGKHVTWVKWAVPTAEALRQACLARESRVSQSEPQKPSIHITALNVSNSQFLGPVTLEFNPQYNAIIGGRGTGKSTIMEYLRWGLCDQPTSDTEGELVDVHRKRRDLIQKTLVPLAAVVEVSFLVNDIPHVVRRRTASSEVLLKIGNQEFKPCTEGDVRGLLPVHAYSQKQLSSIGVRLEELDRFIHAPIERDLAQIRATRDDLKSKLRASYEDVRRHRALTVELAKQDLERTSLTSQIEHLRASLKGLSEEDRKVIAQQSLHEEEERLISSWEEELRQVRTSIAEIAEQAVNAPTGLVQGEIPNQDLLSRMHGDLDRWFQKLRLTLQSLSTSLDQGSDAYALRDYSQALTTWRARHEANAKAYEEAKKRTAAQESTLQQIRTIEERLRALETQSAEKRRALQKMGDPTPKFQQFRGEWVALHQKESGLLEQQCANLTTLSKGQIRARLRRGHRVETVDQVLRNALKGTKVRGERYDALWQRVRAAADPLVEWNSVLDELEELASIEADEEAKVTLPATPILEGLGFTERERSAIARALKPESWLPLLTQGLEDLPEFEYRSRESEYIKFGDASAGQQATALLCALLNQSGPPLVIDQPEDDLDNKVMDEIVHEIWNAKSRRQLVFTSHNANLVVNGDSELVVCCDYRVAGDQSGGKVKLEGAIDMPDINAEITLVMEGGREAFSLRRAKYGF